jgi:uncharacterized membrane protein YoaT (DUF817 family)
VSNSQGRQIALDVVVAVACLALAAWVTLHVLRASLPAAVLVTVVALVYGLATGTYSRSQRARRGVVVALMGLVLIGFLILLALRGVFGDLQYAGLLGAFAGLVIGSDLSARRARR